MGRSRGYNENDVLSGAMHAFRRKGFSAASIRDLEDATGLRAGSIYNSFGDKAGLFEAAFAHYNRTVLGWRLTVHADAASGLGGMRRLFLSLLHEPDDESLGCLITNAAVEFGGAEGLPAGVDEGLRTLLDAFSERLIAARAAGLLGGGVRPRSAALRLLALYQGILVLIRAGHDKPALADLINDEFDVLEGKTHDA